MDLFRRMLALAEDKAAAAEVVSSFAMETRRAGRRARTTWSSAGTCCGRCPAPPPR
ncbi:hypothetical protein AB0F91_28835 [Amycolatopsis sp. NPDC023774]|uniref:hypothetical protein n=1 Tax=Amycolatopsis sp. NPDC023774 TaxID=3155015 RepID=UPI003406F364